MTRPVYEISFEDSMAFDDRVLHSLYLGLNDNRVIDLVTDSPIVESESLPERIFHWSGAWFAAQEPVRYALEHKDIPFMEGIYVRGMTEEISEKRFPLWNDEFAERATRLSGNYALQIVPKEDKFVFRLIRDDDYTIEHPTS